MLRYVILEHDWPVPHFDLMLEGEGVLLTFRMILPLMLGEQSVERIADHRLYYLDYEGPVSGNRGTVKRQAQGTYTWLVQTIDEHSIRLDGDLLGTMHLNKVREASPSAELPSLTLRVGTTWRLRWEPQDRDEAA